MQPGQMTPKKRKRLHSCSICGGSYSTPSQLQRHSRVHSGERPYVCNLCGRRFTRSDHVKQHLKIHSPHRQKNMCRICGSQFYKSQILGSHLRRHDVYQIHLCRQCGEGFQEPEELEKHERLHNIKTDIRPSAEGTDGVPSTSAEPKEGDGNWLGCARFCLAQIPSISNKILQTPDRKNENSCEENADAIESTEFNNIEVTSKASPEEENDSPQLSVSPGYSLVIASPNQPEENVPTEAITSSSNSTIFMVATPPNNVENEAVVKTTTTSTSPTPAVSRSASRKAGRPIKAVIKREPIVTTTTVSTSANEMRAAPRCTISLLAASRTSVTRAEVCTRRTISSTTPTPASNAVVMTTPKEMTTTTATTTNPSPMGIPPFLLNGKRLGRCEYCGIWFEDYAMCMLHNSLHSADDADPFTCRKCLKKLGNRLEFMAHLVWHLDPELP